MRRMPIIALATLFAASAFAQTFTPPGQPFANGSLALGTEFSTLFISCGTPVTPECPKTLAPLASPVLVHYITLGGRSTSTSNCSGWLYVERTGTQGVERTELMRLVLVAGGMDNMVLTLPKPIRLEAGDVIGVAVAQGTCAMLADFGIETLE